MDISYKIMNQYASIENKSIETLKELAIFCYDGKSLLEIVIGYLKDGKTIVYQLSSYNKFDIIEKTVNGNDIGLWTGGIKTNECFSVAHKEIMNNIPLMSVYQNTFDFISSEGIGGKLNVYKLDENNIDLTYENNIQEKDEIKRISLNSTNHLIVAERLQGQIICGNNLTIDATNSSSEQIFKVDSTGVKISGLALEITDGGLPSSQIDPSFTNSFLNLSNTYNGVKINSENGLVIQKTDGFATLTNQIVLNATDGLKIQKNIGTYASPSWQTNFSVNTSGDINFTGSIVNNSDVLINASTKTIDFSKFTTKLGTITATNIDATNLHVSAANIDGTLFANQITVGSTTNFASGYNPATKTTSSDVVSIVNGTVTASYIDALNVTAQRLIAKTGSIITTDVYQDTYGGKILIYDAIGNLDIKIGTESGTGANRAGTLVLYDDAPPNSDITQYVRVSAGIGSSSGGGLFNLSGSDNKIRATLQASPIIGGGGLLALTNNSQNTTIQISAGGISYFNGGNVAIGSNFPSYTLDVSGDINFSGNIYKNGVLYTGATAVFA